MLVGSEKQIKEKGMGIFVTDCERSRTNDKAAYKSVM